MSFVKNYFVSLIENLHLRVLGSPMGPGTRNLFKYFLYSLVGGGLSAGLLFIINVISGRIMGPAEYGKYALVLSLLQVFVIPMLLSMDIASIRSISIKQGSRVDVSKIISTGLTFVLTAIFSVAVISFLFSNKISNLLKIEVGIFQVAIIFSLVLSIKTYLDSLIRGLSEFKLQYIVRIIEAAVVAIAFVIIFFGFGIHRYFVYAFALAVGAAVTIAIFFSKKIINFFYIAYINKITFVKLWRFARLAIPSSIGGVLIVSADKLIIGKYLGSYNLGIYNAYYTASVLLVIQLGTIIVNAFFPEISKQTDHLGIIKKLNKFIKIVSLPAIILMSAITYLVLRFFGRSYGVDWFMVIGMSTYSILNLIWIIYFWLISSRGNKGMAFTSLHYIVSGGIYLLLLILFLPHLKLHAAPIAFIISFIYIYFMIKVWEKKLRGEFQSDNG